MSRTFRKRSYFYKIQQSTFYMTQAGLGRVFHEDLRNACLMGYDNKQSSYVNKGGCWPAQYMGKTKKFYKRVTSKLRRNCDLKYELTICE